MDTVRQASPNVLKKGQITPYPMPGQEALALKTAADNATPAEVTRRIARINRL